MNHQEKNREQLLSAIDAMSTQKAPEGLWSRIEDGLENREETDRQHLKNAISHLPEHTLKSDLWEGISDSISKKNSRVISLPVKTLKIAATVAFIITSVSIFLISTSKKVSYEISTEVVDEGFIEIEAEKNDQMNIQSEIDVLCSFLPENCTDPIINELKGQLEEVTTQYDDIKTMFEQENSPELYKYMLRIENEKAEIEKQLLNIIINS